MLYLDILTVGNIVTLALVVPFGFKVLLSILVFFFKFLLNFRVQGIDLFLKTVKLVSVLLLLLILALDFLAHFLNLVSALLKLGPNIFQLFEIGLFCLVNFLDLGLDLCQLLSGRNRVLKRSDFLYDFLLVAC